MMFQEIFQPTEKVGEVKVLLELLAPMTHLFDCEGLYQELHRKLL